MGVLMAGQKTTNRYFELVEELPLRVIRNDKDLKRAHKMLNRLLDAGKLTREEQDYFDVLAQLIETYEDEHVEIPDVSDVEMLSFLIEQKGVKQKDVAAGTAIPISTISELLSGKRRFNKAHIEKLAGYFNVSPAVFIKTKRELITA
jgi:HTH-type transcriptional regulator/antitoxin HigA